MLIPDYTSLRGTKQSQAILYVRLLRKGTLAMTNHVSAIKVLITKNPQA